MALFVWEKRMLSVIKLFSVKSYLYDSILNNSRIALSQTHSEQKIQLPIRNPPFQIVHSPDPTDFPKQVSLRERHWGIQFSFLLIRPMSNHHSSLFKSCQPNPPTAQINVNTAEEKCTKKGEGKKNSNIFLLCQSQCTFFFPSLFYPRTILCFL